MIIEKNVERRLYNALFAQRIIQLKIINEGLLNAMSKKERSVLTFQLNI